MEFDELRKPLERIAVHGSRAEVCTARAEQFERFLCRPCFVSLVVQGCGLPPLAAGEGRHAGTLQQATVSMTLNGLLALIAFQFGKYSAVLARSEHASCAARKLSLARLRYSA